MLWFIFIVQGLICGGFSAFIAGQKNRSSAGWFGLGMLFGIFALIGIAAVPKLSFEKKELSTGEIQCSHCGAANRSGASVCYSCGKSI